MREPAFPVYTTGELELVAEIERLRAALEEIRDYKGLRPGAISWATEIAIRALKDKQ